jgi:glucokinase
VAVERAGVVVPGLVDPGSGLVRLAANISWPSPSVAQDLAAGLGIPIVLGHDVAAAGLAEHHLGAGRGVGDVVVVAIGTGIAATLVSGGRMLTGGRTADGRVGQAGELGHLRVPSAGERLCGCGQLGCLETVASARAIARDYAALRGESVAGADEVVARLADDPLARQVWDRAVQALAEGLLATCALVAPSRVVLAGGLSAAGDALLVPLRAALEEQACVAVVPDLVTASLGTRAGVIGAALLATAEDSTVFNPPTAAGDRDTQQAVS